MRKFVSRAVFLLAICLFGSSFLVGQVSLTIANNCGSGCNPPIAAGTVIGTINVTQNGPDSLTVTLTMSSGFTLKVQDGNDFNFNGPSGLTVSNLNVTWDGAHPGSANNVAFGVSTGNNVSAFGTFAYNIHGIATGLKDSAHNAVTSVTGLSFTVTSTGAISPADLINAFNSDSADFAIHFCDADGSNCTPFTGFAANGTAQVPEPPVTALLACSGLMLGFFRRLLT
jgi:hypothetical protein